MIIDHDNCKHWIAALSLVALLAIVSTPSTTLACRYTIRDIGFVDMQGPVFTLWLIGGDADLADQAKEWLGPCNIKVAVVDAAQSDHPAIRAAMKNADTPETETKGPIKVVLEGRDNHWLWIGAGNKDAGCESLVRSVVESPLRNRIQSEALDTFGFVIAREFSMTELDRAVDRLKQFESQLPRSIDHPVRKIVLTKEQAVAERVLLWSLGFPKEGPSVAVVYGRGKRLGDVLVNDSLNVESIATQLAFVGESCECETDRDWVNEPVMPLRWGPEQWEQTRTLLGFDPESPLVKAEVVRIIGKGIRPDGEKKGNQPDDLAGILLGYREVPLESNRVVSSDVGEDESPAADHIANPSAPAVPSHSADLAQAPADLESNAPNQNGTATQSNRLLSGTMLAIVLIVLLSLFGCAFMIMRRQGAH